MKLSKGLKLLLTLFFLIYGTSIAKPKTFGIGFIVGDPTGISLKYWLDPKHAIAGGLAWALGGYLYMHGDFLIHNKNLLRDLNIREGSFVLHYGVGAKVELSHSAVVGIRIPLGVNFIFKRIPFDIFFEIAPVVNLIPATTLDINGGIGFRFYPF